MTEKEKIEQTDKLEDAKKADELESEAKGDKDAIESNDTKDVDEGQDKSKDIQDEEKTDIEKIKEENIKLKEELFYKSLEGLNDDQKDFITELDGDVEYKSKLVEAYKQLKDIDSDFHNHDDEASIDENIDTYDEQFDEEGNVKVKNLDEII